MSTTAHNIALFHRLARDTDLREGSSYLQYISPSREPHEYLFSFGMLQVKCKGPLVPVDG